MNDIVTFIRETLEPDGQADLDETAAEPFDWLPNTLYAYLLPMVIHEPFESGPSVYERFSARIVYVADDEGEAAGRRRSADVSDLLDQKRSAYLDALRRAMSAPPHWSFASAREVAAPDTLQTRAVSLQLSGYRILTS
ncbi:MAG: hypothetical protein H0V50_02765 [Thermoleophilaceae bacterium]|nr:hypothetical protein [Thermoleophilaceae bacterium]